MLLVLVWGAVAHNYGTSTLRQHSQSLFGECAPDDACEANRKCAFGSLENYAIARNDLFQVTGYPNSCIDQCDCTPSSQNDVQEQLDIATSTGKWYDIPICNNSALKQAMYYHTSGYACERVFEKAQQQLILLCGMQNGVSCQGKCTEQYQIDTPVPLCEQNKDIEDSILYAIFGYILLGCTLWSWTSGVDINEQKLNTLSQRFTSTRYRYSHGNDDSEFESLLGSFF